MNPLSALRLPTACVAYLTLLSLTLLLPHRVAARLTMQGDPLNVGDATRVVIVKPDGTDVFRIEEVLLDEDEVGTGDDKNAPETRVQVGEAVTLPGFSLFTQQMYGPDKVDPITENIRILLYLRRKAADTPVWVVAQSGYAFFWVQDPGKVEELREKARQAILIRNEWNAATSTPGVQQRIEALWPFLEKHNGRFRGAVQEELQRIGPPAGDYLAGRFSAMNSNLRMTFLTELNLYQSERLHTLLLQHLKNQQKLYEEFLKGRGGNEKSVIDDWNALPDDIKAIWGELYYGLDGLAKFKDREDLPFIRQLAGWAIKYRCKQTCDAALGAFRDMPDKANLPVIAALWQEFSVHPYKGNDMSPLDVTRALRTHKYPETVPVLVEILTHKNKDFAVEAQAFLTEIVGRDLGPEPAAWLHWYKTQ